MAFKFNFFARPINSDYRVDWESLTIELSLGVICAVMSLYGWQTGMGLMAYPAGFVAVLCFGLVIFTVINAIIEKVKAK